MDKLFLFAPPVGQVANSQASSLEQLYSMAPMIIIMVLMYVLLIFPNSKKRKEHEKKITSLQKGDKVITESGILVTIVKPKEHTFIVSINNEKTTMEIQRSSVKDIISEKETKEGSKPTDSKETKEVKENKENKPEEKDSEALDKKEDTPGGANE